VFFWFGGLLPGDPGDPARDTGARVEQVPEQSDDLCPAQVQGGGVAFVRRQGDDDDA
jgi:hypothetical protein